MGDEPTINLAIKDSTGQAELSTRKSEQQHFLDHLRLIPSSFLIIGENFFDVPINVSSRGAMFVKTAKRMTEFIENFEFELGLAS